MRTPAEVLESLRAWWKGKASENARTRNQEQKGWDSGILAACEYVRRRLNDERLALEMHELLTWKLPREAQAPAVDREQEPERGIVLEVEEVPGGMGPDYAVLTLRNGKALVIDEEGVYLFVRPSDAQDGATQPEKGFSFEEAPPAES